YPDPCHRLLNRTPHPSPCPDRPRSPPPATHRENGRYLRCGRGRLAAAHTTSDCNIGGCPFPEIHKGFLLRAPTARSGRQRDRGGRRCHSRTTRQPQTIRRFRQIPPAL